MGVVANLKKAAVKAVINHKGKSMKPKKWVIIESDDWGSIRTSSKKSYENLLKKGYPVDQCSYNRLDALESNTDLEALFETLHSVKDAAGNPANITFNTIMTNPDFSAIEKSDYQEYHSEHFFQTLKKYPKHDRVELLYAQGIKAKCITPQFHGREHLHVNNWMQALKLKQQDILDAFKEEMFTVHNLNRFSCKDFNLDAWAMHSSTDERVISDAIVDGLNLFEKTFAYKSKSAIAPCFSMSERVEKVLHEQGVNHIQGAYIQDRIRADRGVEKVKHFMGRKNKYGQFFTIRNANFEPSIHPDNPWIESVLQDVYWAFFWGKPAIINTHRINFIGYLDEKNRTNNLYLLKQILQRIVRKWPDMRFVSSAELSDYYK
jgi:hypothetical protein